MKIKLNIRLLFPPTLLLIPVLIIAACAPAVSSNIVVAPQASPTPSALPLTMQPTEPVSTTAPLVARLAVLEYRARVIRGGEIQSELQQAQSTDIQIDDRIEIVRRKGQNQQSYSLLYIPDLLNVELFADTSVVLADARKSAGMSHVTLELAAGHMFVHLNEKRATRVTVQTPQATISTLTPDAEFDLCRTEELTCIVVQRGIVEISTQDKHEIVRAGSASVILADQPLSAAICAPSPKFTAWEERYRMVANAPSLQAEIAELPQEACPEGADGLPLDARILYRDEFTTASRGWEQGQLEHFLVRYVRSSGARYYQVQAQGPENRYLTFVPNQQDYEDVNIDLKTRTEAESGGDFRYGVVFRGSGDQYYAFVVSPTTEAWYFLKSSANGIEILKYGVEKRMRGLEGQDTLRVETYGSTFLAFINGRFIDWVSDPEYARGEVGLFVDTIGNPDARINFNTITIWDIPAAEIDSSGGENCFNASDDDGDGKVDQADPNCQRSDLDLATSPLPTSTPGIIGTPTAPPGTNPPASTPTNRPAPTPTNRPPATQPPLPLPTLSIPTVVLPLPTIALPTISLPIPTISLPLPTISLPLPTLGLPLAPPATTPRP